MADVHEPETRSYNMSQIKGKDTKPEMLVRKFLHANGFRYRLHVKKLPIMKAIKIFVIDYIGQHCIHNYLACQVL